MKRTRGSELKAVKYVQPGFKLEEDVWYKVKALALKQRRKAGELMREAVKEYLQRHIGGEAL